MNKIRFTTKNNLSVLPFLSFLLIFLVNLHALFAWQYQGLNAADSIAIDTAGNEFTTSANIPAVDFSSSNLPIIVINTHGQEIVDEPKITADMGIIWNGAGERNNLTDPFNNYNGKIGIEIRGSSSQMFPKKQYGVETRDESGDDVNVSLLGLPEENDWVLYAPYSDKSLLRNVLAYKVFNEMGRYASRAVFCELVLNGDYRGIYVLMEKIKRDKNRVNISKMDEADTTGDALTGGYLIKIDKREGSDTQGWYSRYLPFSGAWQRIYYQYDYPDQDDIVPGQKKYIQEYIDGFETLMNGPDYYDPGNGYAKYIDVGSFVDFFIHTEVGKNVDGYRLSAFMHKNRDSKGGKLNMGPAWDFNLAFGNADYYSASGITGWQVDFQVQSDEFQLPFWWKKLVADSSFRRQIYLRWQELRSDILDILNLNSCIDSLTAYLDEAQKRNFERWPILNQYVWPNAYIGGNYLAEIRYLKNWLANRITWMDANIPGREIMATEQPEKAVPQDFFLGQNYPNPFNAQTRIPVFLNHSGYARITIYNILGEKVAVLWKGKAKPGKMELELNGNNLPSGIYFYRLQMENITETRKMLLSR